MRAPDHLQVRGRRGLRSAASFGAFLLFCCVGAGCGTTAVGETPQPRAEEPAQPLLAPPAPPAHREVRATGTTQAVRYLVVQTPRISGQNVRLVLVRLAPNGAVVEKGDVLAEFDPTSQLEARR